MNYKELKWGALKSYAKTLGINTKGLKRFEIEQKIRDLNVVPFKGVKETHPLFNDPEIEELIPYLKAYKKIGAVSSIGDINKKVAIKFHEHIETDKGAVLNLGCGNCIPKYYKRFAHNYDLLATEYGEPLL